MSHSYVSVSDIADAIGGVVWGDDSIRICKISLNFESDDASLTYFKRNSSLDKIKKSKFMVAIVESLEDIADDRTYIYINKDIYSVLHFVTEMFIKSGILELHDTNNSINDDVILGNHVSIGLGVSIGAGCKIGDNVCIGNGVVIGNECTIFPNTTISERVVIGNHVIVQSGSVIGSNSFEYAECDGNYYHIKNIGNVIIHDRVEIGANTTIDRGTIGNTHIGEGTIIDNQVQIGHEVRIGEKCKICSQCGIAGWSVVENYVIIYGQVGIANNITIGERTIVLAKSGVSKSIDKGKTVFGIPAQDSRTYFRQLAFHKNMYRKTKGEWSNGSRRTFR